MRMLTMRLGLLLVMVGLLVPGAGGAAGAVAAAPVAAPVGGPGTPAPHFGRLPLAFEPNAGQADPAVRFLAHVPGGLLAFTPGAVLLVPAAPAPEADPSVPGGKSSRAASADRPAPAPLRIRFLDANPAATVSGGAAASGRVNYFLGRDPRRWQVNLPTYAAITYQALYPGIDLEYAGTGGHLKGTYHLAPGADPARIRWQYTGADKVTVDAEGNLQIATASATKLGTRLAEQAPVAWQEQAGQRVPVAVRYTLAAGGQVGFAVAGYDRSRPLILDPALGFATYLGGSQDDVGAGVAVDATGAVYVTGQTASPNFPVANAIQPGLQASTAAFITRLNPAGTAPIYSTYLGGSQGSAAFAIAVDGGGQAYITGNTLALDFPVVNAFQPTNHGTSNAFVAKLTPSGAGLVYSTYLGGFRNDTGRGIVVDGAGSAYVTGFTNSFDFPVRNAYLPGYRGGGREAFVTKFTPAGNDLVYSTYLGGYGENYGLGIAVDAAGEVAVAGWTDADDFPVVNAVQPTCNGCLLTTEDAFVTKFNAAGSAPIFSTYLGGSGGDEANAVAMDAAGNVYVAGYTNSDDFPLANPLQDTLQGTYDAFVGKLSATGSTLVYATYLGGTGDDQANGILVDDVGNVAVTGNTNSDDFPLLGALQDQFGGSGVTFYGDAFVSALNPSGNGLLFSTYLGGSDDDVGAALALDIVGNLYVAGWSQSVDFPLGGAFQNANGGGRDAWIVKIGTTPLPVSCPIQFADVPAGSPFYAYVRCLACRNIAGGYGDNTFRPGANVTRGQLAKFVANAAGYQDAIPATRQTFSDVPPGSPFWVFVERVAAHGVVGGYSDGTFRPGATVTRGQVAKFVANAAGYADAIPPTHQTFADVPPGNPFWLFIERVAAHGVVGGYADNTFRPGNAVTRGQTAKFISNGFFPNCQTP